MTYVQISRTPGASLADYERVRREMGQDGPDGSLHHRAGIADGALVVVGEWESRAQADRFAAERLFPAFERAGVRPRAATEITAFEAAPPTASGPVTG